MYRQKGSRRVSGDRRLEGPSRAGDGHGRASDRRCPAAGAGRTRSRPRGAPRRRRTAGPADGGADRPARGGPSDKIGLAGELHDVGKTAIPDSILDKPGPLTPTEWEFMRRHTLIGERIVLAAPALEHTAALVRSSHERIDGTGYPDGLHGQQIPVGARIISICDAFDAMVTPRPYRDAAVDEGGHGRAAPRRRHASSTPDWSRCSRSSSTTSSMACSREGTWLRRPLRAPDRRPRSRIRSPALRVVHGGVGACDESRRAGRVRRSRSARR